MNEHDARILGPKNKPVTNALTLLAFRDSHPFCQACGAGEYGTHVLTNHHIIGGRGGRSDEDCNLLRLGWEPCHMLAEGLDIRGPEKLTIKRGMNTGSLYEEKTPGDLLPKITLGIALSMKIRAGELYRYTITSNPAQMSAAALESGAVEQVVTSPEWDRLSVLHGRTLPDLADIPAFFVDLYSRNRPELVRAPMEGGDVHGTDRRTASRTRWRSRF